LPLTVIHGLVTVSTPGPVRNSYSVRVLGQNYRNRNQNKVRDYVDDDFFLCTLFYQPKQWQFFAPDRPCAQHVQSTRRMSLRPRVRQTRGFHFCSTNQLKTPTSIGRNGNNMEHYHLQQQKHPRDKASSKAHAHITTPITFSARAASQDRHVIVGGSGGQGPAEMPGAG
jgi:hypothetical protein